MAQPHTLFVPARTPETGCASTSNKSSVRGVREALSKCEARSTSCVREDSEQELGLSCDGDHQARVSRQSLVGLIGLLLPLQGLLGRLVM